MSAQHCSLSSNHLLGTICIHGLTEVQTLSLSCSRTVRVKLSAVALLPGHMLLIFLDSDRAQWHRGLGLIRLWRVCLRVNVDSNETCSGVSLKLHTMSWNTSLLLLLSAQQHRGKDVHMVINTQRQAYCWLMWVKRAECTWSRVPPPLLCDIKGDGGASWISLWSVCELQKHRKKVCFFLYRDETWGWVFRCSDCIQSWNLLSPSFWL